MTTRAVTTLTLTERCEGQTNDGGRLGFRSCANRATATRLDHARRTRQVCASHGRAERVSYVSWKVGAPHPWGLAL